MRFYLYFQHNTPCAPLLQQVLSIPLDHVAQRLLLLKQLLPDCDVARMVELQPLLLLRCERQYLVDVVKPRLQALAEGLPGADIAEMMQDDPRLLFEELESSMCSRHSSSWGCVISLFLVIVRCHLQVGVINMLEWYYVLYC